MFHVEHKARLLQPGFFVPIVCAFARSAQRPRNTSPQVRR
ncbi:hypothetical protein FDH89_gp71 [Pseudomonas phage phiR18]|uniref:Uncharacterized protein n=1 Tax=Pseudomonas phage phiR18 TaxID=1752027 RepID=A0A0S3UFY1_9CAUD|nr:hypothetical protein FDH89_gp71 [Pseudomonas phage phiR18]BAU16399.1 hypothetical protein [Pseudomonas phage phiR18]